MPPAGSTRWCPTPEQLMILEELYRGGIRTPNSTLIQKITTNLSLYGKIEGKNVFYWFQNHKARDRQKLRRKLLRQQQQQQIHVHHHVLHQIDSPSYSSSSATAALQLLPLYNQAHLLPQGRESANQVMMGGYGWKTMDTSAGVEMEKPDKMCGGQDWKMTIMMNASPYCNRPPKTLQLFPITTMALKDECTTSHHHFSCSTSTTNKTLVTADCNQSNSSIPINPMFSHPIINKVERNDHFIGI